MSNKDELIPRGEIGYFDEKSDNPNMGGLTVDDFDRIVNKVRENVSLNDTEADIMQKCLVEAKTAAQSILIYGCVKEVHKSPLSDFARLIDGIKKIIITTEEEE